MKSNDAERLGSVEPFKQALLEMLLKRVPKCTERILPEFYHGEFSINHPDRYVDYIAGLSDG